MQTRLDGPDGTARHGESASSHSESASSLMRRATAMLCAVVSAAALGGCTAPRIDGRAEAEQSRSECETSYFAAKSHSRTMRGDSHIIVRYLAAKAAQNDWTTVASSCQQRFAEGTIRSAQAEHTAVTLGSLIGRNDGYHAVSASAIHDATGSGLAGDVLGDLAIAEDRAGFIMEILAAQNASGATLRRSDDHKTAGQMLFSLSSLDSDPRKKVYDITKFISHVDSMTDSETGLTAPTIALTEIDCAREQLNAVDDAQHGGTTSQTGDVQPGAMNGSLRTLSQLIASRLTAAFDFGYPDTDMALFE